MNYVLAKAIGAAVLALLSLDWPRRAIERRVGEHGLLKMIAIFALTRITAACLAFGVAGFPAPGDATVFYVPIAQAVMSGGLESGSPYNPGFDYLLAALYRLTGSPFSFGAFFIAAEIAAYACALATLKRWVAPMMLPIAVLWLVSPQSLFHIALGGQDESVILLGFCAALWLAADGRLRFAGMAISLAFLGSKIYGVFAALPLVIPTYRRQPALVAGLATFAAGVATLVYFRVPLFGVLNEAVFATAGNVWAFPMIAFSADGLPHAQPWQFAGSVAANATTMWLVLRRPLARHVEQVLRLSGTVGCIFLITAPQSYVAYLMMFLPGILYLLLRLRTWERTILILLLVPVATFESSLWFRFGEGLLFAEIPNSRRMMIATDAVLIGGCLWVAARGVFLRDK